MPVSQGLSFSIGKMFVLNRSVGVGIGQSIPLLSSIHMPSHLRETPYTGTGFGVPKWTSKYGRPNCLISREQPS